MTSNFQMCKYEFKACIYLTNKWSFPLEEMIIPTLRKWSFPLFRKWSFPQHLKVTSTARFCHWQISSQRANNLNWAYSFDHFHLSFWNKMSQRNDWDYHFQNWNNHFLITKKQTKHNIWSFDKFSLNSLHHGTCGKRENQHLPSETWPQSWVCKRSVYKWTLLLWQHCCCCRRPKNQKHPVSRCTAHIGRKKHTV